MKYSQASIVMAFLVLTVSSCRDFIGKKRIKEGIIKYEITYDSTTSKKMDTRLLPSSLLVKFKDNNTLNTIDAFSGAISISIISNSNTNQFVTLVKVFNKKMYHEEPNTDGKYPALYSRIPSVKIISNNEKCKLLGYNCLKARGYFEDQPNSEFEIIYTKDIDISSPNINTPFEKIDGVMLGFNLRINSLMMQLKAQSVKKSKIPDETFSIPADYSLVDFQTITDLIYLLQQ
ncbi:MAG TPA: hypothetical protein PLH91_04285 [Tenuifilaceae bacterium]|nr:hypothetical protein [Tenuifilaceae bacterium]HOZ15854.1 hypothetical protein [Tenuifilaceae bacterium]HPI44429.1 hypothetical protein [Tenuifilaceae bacterium]HPN21702.1 hypothetical protein [Tenuifilaceae bacterium]HPV55953.1 hypothetical protein [Tenuifilaceae bacterium]